MIQWKGMPRQRVLWAVVALLVLCCAAAAAVAGSMYYRSADQVDLTIDLIPEEGYLVQRTVPLGAQASTVALGAPSAGANWTASPPVMMGEVYSIPLYFEDEYDQIWNSNTKVEIFKTSYENDAQEITVAGRDGSKIIAPGTSNDFTFALYNNIRDYVDYKLVVNTAVTGVDGITEFPVEMRIKGINGWVIGDEDTWVPALEVNGAEDTGVSPERLSALYTLEWRWPYESGQDELDTWLGNQTEDVIFSINLQTIAVYHPDDDDEGDVEIDDPTGEGGGSGGTVPGGPNDPEPPVVPPITEPIPEHLRPEQEHGHQAYIYGYEDGTLRPEANITRAEVAAIFYRLLKDDVRQQHYTLACDYPDVPMDSWFRAEVATMTNMGIVKGYPDGSFRPNDPITRAELTAIVSRFTKPEWSMSLRTAFIDIDGHWANAEIRSVEDKNWIIGYPDSTFRPDNTITRAETVTIVNRVLHRLPERFEDLLEEMPIWPDNEDRGQWYFIAMQEAAVGHTYERVVGTREKWITLLDAPGAALIQ